MRHGGNERKEVKDKINILTAAFLIGAVQTLYKTVTALSDVDADPFGDATERALLTLHCNIKKEARRTS